MIQLSDEQVNKIQERIIHDGVTDHGLQNDLLDHYCCYVEEEMQNGNDFEMAYATAFQAISPNGMHEIEEELIFLLTFKKQTVMKRTILITGALTVVFYVLGIVAKYLHAPGASISLTLAIGIASLLFIPTVFVLKAREKQKTSEKILWAIGSLFASILTLSVLFKVQHWPGANVMGVTSIGILMLVYLPYYFISGFRNRETRVNTIVISVFIIIACGLYFTLTLTPSSARLIDARVTKGFLRNEAILKNEQSILQKSIQNDTANNSFSTMNRKIYGMCTELKTLILKWDTGNDAIVDDFENKHVLISLHSVEDFLTDDIGQAKLSELTKAVDQYNAACAGHPEHIPIPVNNNIIDLSSRKIQYKTIEALTDLFQIQLILLQNQRTIASL